MKETSNHHFILLFFALTFLFSLLAVGVCLRGNVPVRLVGSVPDPAESAGAFLTALGEGNYTAASALCLPALPSENAPVEEDTELLYGLLKDSWQGCIAGKAVLQGDTATIPVTLSVLDTAALCAGLKENVNDLLAQYVKEARLPSDVYNEDGSYREDTVRRAWDTALAACAEHPGEMILSRPLTLTLRYRDGQWRIMPDEDLLSALSGEVGA